MDDTSSLDQMWIGLEERNYENILRIASEGRCRMETIENDMVVVHACVLVVAMEMRHRRKLRDADAGNG